MDKKANIFLAKKLFTELVFNTADSSLLKECLMGCIKGGNGGLY